MPSRSRSRSPLPAETVSTDSKLRRRSPLRGNDERQRHGERDSRRRNEDGRRHHHRHHVSRGHSEHSHSGSASNSHAARTGNPEYANGDTGMGVASPPERARRLTKHDLDAWTPLFAHYLDVQKGIDIRKLGGTELRGRWKSFVGKWNRRELAGGWYQAEIFERVGREWVDGGRGTGGMATGGGLSEEGGSGVDMCWRVRGSQDGAGSGVGEGGRHESGQLEACVTGRSSARIENDKQQEEGDDDDEYGPVLPGTSSSTSRPKGPGVPGFQDLHLRRELAAEDAEARRADLRSERKADRRDQKERLEELMPRADAGTRERRLEKRKEVNDKMRSFRDRSPGGDEVADEDLVGGADGGVADYKRMLATEKQKVSERQLRREEVARAKAAEREERVSAYREREERTMEKLKELARARFG